MLCFASRSSCWIESNCVLGQFVLHFLVLVESRLGSFKTATEITCEQLLLACVGYTVDESLGRDGVGEKILGSTLKACQRTPS